MIGKAISNRNKLRTNICEQMVGIVIKLPLLKFCFKWHSCVWDIDDAIARPLLTDWKMALGCIVYFDCHHIPVSVSEVAFDPKFSKNIVWAFAFYWLSSFPYTFTLSKNAKKILEARFSSTSMTQKANLVLMLDSIKSVHAFALHRPRKSCFKNLANIFCNPAHTLKRPKIKLRTLSAKCFSGDTSYELKCLMGKTSSLIAPASNEYCCLTHEPTKNVLFYFC